MKKYAIIFAAALVAMCACTKSEPMQNGPEKEISFQVASYLNQTKANSAYDTKSTFGVYAWFDSENTTIAAEQNQAFMVNETVAYTGSEWKVDGKTYYWPKTGNIDFFAYAPVARTPWIACNDATHTLTAAETTIAGDEDFMYSSMAMDYNENVETYFTTGVPVLFHHALAKLTVNFKAGKLVDPENEENVWEITVNQAEFLKVCNAGSLTLAMAEDTETAPEVIEWTLPTNAIWTASTTADKVALQAAKGLELTDEFDADLLEEYTVLPQALAGMNFHINFTIKASNDGGDTWYSTETVDRTYSVIDTEDEDGAFTAAGNFWKMNTKVTYNVTITPSSDEILFDPAVVDWETAEGSKDIQY